MKHLILFLLLTATAHAQVAGWFTNTDSGANKSEPATFFEQIMIGFGVDEFRIRSLTSDPTATGAYGDVGDLGAYSPSGLFVKKNTSANDTDWAKLLATSELSGTDNQITVNPDGSGGLVLALPQDITPTADVEFNSVSLGQYIDFSQTGSISNPPSGSSRIAVKTDGNAYIRQSGGGEKVLTSGDVLSEVCLVRDVQASGTQGGDPGGAGAYVTVTRDVNNLSGTCGHVELVGSNQFRLTPSGSFCMEAESSCYDSELTSVFLFNVTDNTVVGNFNYPTDTFCSGITGNFGSQNIGAKIETKACVTYSTDKLIELRWHGKRSNDVPGYTLGIPIGALGSSDATATGSIEVHSLIKVEKFE